MKKTYSKLLAFSIALSMLILSSCGNSSNNGTTTENTSAIINSTENTVVSTTTIDITTAISETVEATTIETPAISTTTIVTPTIVETTANTEAVETKETFATTVPTIINMTTHEGYGSEFTSTAVVTEATISTPEVTIITEATTTEIIDIPERTTVVQTYATTEITTPVVTSATTTEIIVPVNTGFDENKVVLSLGMVSDIHVNSSSSVVSSRGETLSGKDKFQRALELLKSYATKNDANGIDAICIVGDLADSGSVADLTAVKTMFETVYDPTKVPMVCVPGNHDNSHIYLNDYYSILGSNYFSYDVDDNLERGGYRHVVVNGYHFILLDPYSYGSSGSVNCPYTAQTKQWLDETLNEITTKDPEKYVFFMTHPMIQNTCYGSGTGIGSDAPLGGYWYTNDLTSILSKYPQVITFGGHLHYPINDERSIMQTAFTSLGCGSVRYMANEAGGYVNALSNTTVEYCGMVSSGYLIQIDDCGNIRITRMNFTDNSTYKTPWELKAPTSDGKVDLTVYDSASRMSKNTAPSMAGSKLEVTSKLSNIGQESFTVTFTKGTDDDFVHNYTVLIKSKQTGTTIASYKIMSDFYLHSDPSDMKDEYSLSLGSIKADGSYIVSVIAEDSWGARSEAISCEFGVSSDIKLPSELPTPVVDIDFSTNALKDKQNAVSLVSINAHVEKTALSFVGKTKTIDALNVTALGQNALIRFNNRNIQDMSNFYNSNGGFAFEALYVNKTPEGSQGIFCGTQTGGLGLAQDGDYPYFYIYTDNSALKLVSTVKASKTELNHIIVSVSYDSKTNITTATMFVNGNLSSTGTVGGKIRPVADNSLCGLLALGADIDKNGGATDFRMSNFSIALAKIYDSELNYLQAESAFNQAKSLFN